jgi:hypothetical protein
MRKHRVLTTDAEIDRAIEQAKLLEGEPLAAGVEYRGGPGLDIIILTLTNGQRRVYPRELMQGLGKATRRQLENIEVLGHGSGINWPDLDTGFYVPALLEGVYGNRAWMAEIGSRGGASRSVRKVTAARENGALGGRPRMTATRAKGRSAKVAA